MTLMNEKSVFEWKSLFVEEPLLKISENQVIKLVTESSLKIFNAPWLQSVTATRW